MERYPMKRLSQSLRGPSGGKGGASADTSVENKRGWPLSLTWAAIIVGIAVTISAVVNPVLGRFVHWDWMAVLAPLLFALFAVAIRRRWV